MMLGIPSGILPVVYPQATDLGMGASTTRRRSPG